MPALNSDEWLNGSNADPVLVSLDPSSRGITVEQQEEIKRVEEEEKRVEEEKAAEANKKV
mgnify:CR=1 FL=1